MEEKTKTIDEKSGDYDDDSSIGSPISLIGSSYYEWVASGEKEFEEGKETEEISKGKMFTWDLSDDELVTFVPESIILFDS